MTSIMPAMLVSIGVMPLFCFSPCVATRPGISVTTLTPSFRPFRPMSKYRLSIAALLLL